MRICSKYRKDRSFRDRSIVLKLARIDDYIIDRFKLYGISMPFSMYLSLPLSFAHSFDDDQLGLPVLVRSAISSCSQFPSPFMIAKPINKENDSWSIHFRRKRGKPRKFREMWNESVFEVLCKWNSHISRRNNYIDRTIDWFSPSSSSSLVVRSNFSFQGSFRFFSLRSISNNTQAIHIPFQK